MRSKLRFDQKPGCDSVGRSFGRPAIIRAVGRAAGQQQRQTTAERTAATTTTIPTNSSIRVNKRRQLWQHQPTQKKRQQRREWQRQRQQTEWQQQKITTTATATAMATATATTADRTTAAETARPLTSDCDYKDRRQSAQQRLRIRLEQLSQQRQTINTSNKNDTTAQRLNIDDN